MKFNFVDTDEFSVAGNEENYGRKAFFPVQISYKDNTCPLDPGERDAKSTNIWE